MSYCRFSSDNWESDVYVYEHVGGYFQCHVASAKHKHPGGAPCPPLDYTSADTLTATYNLQTAWLKEAVVSPLQLPHVEDFTTPTAGEMAEQLIGLRAMGYHVPQKAIDRLMEEDKE